MIAGVPHRLLLGAAALALAGAAPQTSDDADAPPPGIVATHEIVLSDVLRNAAKAQGEWDAGVASVTEIWQVKAEGLTGTETVLLSGDDYRADLVRGPLHEAHGSYHGKNWSLDYNGYAIVDSSGETGQDRDRAVLAEARRRGAAEGVTLLGRLATRITPSPAAAYVVEVRPAGAHPEYLFFDSETYRLTRVERVKYGHRIVTDYDDFRPVAGRTIAWHVLVSDGRPANDEERTLQSFAPHAGVDEAALQIPGDTRAPLTLAAPENRLPAKIEDDRVIVTVTIGSRKVNLQLDSGASGILLNSDVASALKLETYGKSTETTAGSYTAETVRIPELDAGGAALHDVFAEAAPFVTWQDAKTPVAGLLGFDFIAGCVVRIDYMAGTVDALAPATFSPPAGAIALPIILDLRVPMIPATVGDATSNRFILDTGADSSMLFTDFVRANPHDTSDRGLGDEMERASPFVGRIGGVGGTLRVRPVQVAKLALGSVTFPPWLFLAMDSEARDFEGEGDSGLIGQDVLRNFTVYLDYPQRFVYLVPNDRYKARYAP